MQGMARQVDRRPPTNNEVIEYCATLLFILGIVAIVVCSLCGCTCTLAY